MTARSRHQATGRSRRTVVAPAGIALAIVLLLAGLGGAAFGYVPVTGSGTAVVDVRLPAPVRVVTRDADGLYPGGPAVSVPVTVSNPADQPFELTGLAADPSTLPAGCPGEAWTITPPTTTVTLDPHASTVLGLSVRLRDDAPDSCQGIISAVRIQVEGRLT
jgi:hypothetical protein